MRGTISLSAERTRELDVASEPREPRFVCKRSRIELGSLELRDGERLDAREPRLEHEARPACRLGLGTRSLDLLEAGVAIAQDDVGLAERDRVLDPDPKRLCVLGLDALEDRERIGGVA